MTTFGFIVCLAGACFLTHKVFQLIDLIENTHMGIKAMLLKVFLDF